MSGNPVVNIPFNRPTVVGEELFHLSQAMENGSTAGDGAFTAKCHAYLEQALDVPRVLLTTSCTHALEMTALLLNLQPGDEVIVPSFTFVSTANAFVLRGARPVFIDIRPDTLNLDECQLETLITDRTRLVVPVHYAGVGCAMDDIMAITRRHGIHVVEDNAHGLFGRYKGCFLGTFGTFATQSFHGTKNITCGEGGALIINDRTFIERAEILREKGTNRRRFIRGQVDKYTWVDIGSSYLPSDLLAAYLYAQLEAHTEIQTKRKRVWDYYDQHLGSWSDAHNVTLPVVPADCEQAYHMYYILLSSPQERQDLIEHLKLRGISSVFHYLPLHLSEMGKKFGGKEGDCPVTEDISGRLLRLPFYTDLDEEEQAQVVEALWAFEPKSVHRPLSFAVQCSGTGQGGAYPMKLP